MATTIQISQKLQKELADKKFSPGESYEDVIWDMIEDTMELKEETVKYITKAKKEIERGEFLTHKQVKKELGI